MKRVSKDGMVVSIEFISLLEYIDRENLRGRVLKVMCPQCSHYIDVNHIKCGCSPPKEVNLFKGCGECGLTFGQGAFRTRGVECQKCKYVLDLFEPYPFREGCVLIKKDRSALNFFLEIFSVFIIAAAIPWGVMFGIEWLGKNDNQVQNESPVSKTITEERPKQQLESQPNHVTASYRPEKIAKPDVQPYFSQRKTRLRPHVPPPHYGFNNPNPPIMFREPVRGSYGIWNGCQRNYGNPPNGYTWGNYNTGYRSYVPWQYGQGNRYIIRRRIIVRRYFYVFQR